MAEELDSTDTIKKGDAKPAAAAAAAVAVIVEESSKQNVTTGSHSSEVLPAAAGTIAPSTGRNEQLPRVLNAASTLGGKNTSISK
jgi:hypothetical protein